MNEFLAFIAGLKTEQGFVAVFLAMISGMWALWMLWREVKNLERTNRSAHYSELDRNYTDILLQAIDRPYLRDPAKIGLYLAWIKEHDAPPKEGASVEASQNLSKRAREYEIYAFLTMNFIETIRDRCYESRETHLYHSFRQSHFIKWLCNDPSPVAAPKDSPLVTTWRPIVALECALHREWFLREARICCDFEKTGKVGKPGKFCIGFVDFVLRLGWDGKAKEWGDRVRPCAELAAEVSEEIEKHSNAAKS